MELGNFFKELDTMFRTKNIKDAENYIIESMKLVQEERDFPALLSIANELGGIYRVTNRFEEAKKVYAIALEVIKLLELENTEQHGTTLLNLASIYAEAKEASEALKLYEKAAAIFERIGLRQDYRMAALYNNVSHAYDMLEKPDQALDYAQRSLAVIKNLNGHDVELATTYTTLASRYISQQENGKAIDCLKEAEKLFLNLPGKFNVHYAATLNSMGEVYYRQGRYRDAAGSFEKALEIIKENYGENKSYIEVSKNLAMTNEMSGAGSMRMTGLGLSESYFNEYGIKMMQEKFPQYRKYMAAGLVGEGSECFGFDDELSESHDFGPGFCIWLSDETYREIGVQMKGAYEQLPKSFKNKHRVETLQGGGRVGVFSIGDFYRKYIGCAEAPKTNVEWFFAPETSYSTVTNGKIFEDNLGEFTKVRNDLLCFYPRDVLLKKLAARMAMMSQAGQYNYERCMRRNEQMAAYLSCAEFVKATASVVYLLNRKYMPFYKWMFKGMKSLERLQEVREMLAQLSVIPEAPENTKNKVALIEEICIKVRDELSRQEFITGPDTFLNSHCLEVMNQISDPQIRNLPVMFDGK